MFYIILNVVFSTSSRNRWLLIVWPTIFVFPTRSRNHWLLIVWPTNKNKDKKKLWPS
jgi:hypothetical protein